MPTNPVKKHLTYSIYDFYKLYVREQRKLGVVGKVMPYRKYRNIIEDLLQRVSIKIIKENYVFTMPYGLGCIFVKGFNYDPTVVKVDFITTKKVGRLVRFLNRHTFGFHFKFRWDKDYSNFRNRAYYVFKPIRDKAGISGKTGLSKHLFEVSKNKKTYTRL